MEPRDDQEGVNATESRDIACWECDWPLSEGGEAGCRSVARVCRMTTPRQPRTAWTSVVVFVMTGVARGAELACPWASEADSERIDEQTVVIRVVVDPDGSVRSAEIVVEPRHGFGKAAAACALDTQFTPAHDASGNAVRARSPPIRVRFTR
jgi:TonB family protein